MRCSSCGTDASENSKYCASCGTGLVRSAEPDQYIGRIIAHKYRVEKLIGEGGMGQVFRAQQLALEKPVVLKVLRHALLSDERTVARFHREAKAASRLNHPNSINVIDFGQTDEGALYIAMEFVSGKDLHQVLSQDWPLPESRVVRLVSQVLSALADAHAAGVIHRDLKPENIMVEPRRGGETDFVKVLDFGIAKIIEDARDDAPPLTRAGFVCGTPEYMSPEQARGATLDNRSDLYAVGVLLYQLTTGVLPFEADSAVGFATKHLNAVPQPPSKRRPDAVISPGMERLILSALSKDPKDRPQTADAFKEELLALLREDAPRRGLGARHRGASPAQAEPPPEISAVAGTTDTHPVAPWTDVEPTVRAIPAVALRRMELEVTPALAVSAAAPSPAARSSIGPFKIITVALVFASVCLVWYYLAEYNRRGLPEEAVPTNAPTQFATGDARQLYAREIPRSGWNEAEAARRAREAEVYSQRGELSQAVAKYREAFVLKPDPLYSLKLGALHHAKNEEGEARNWWWRHLRDSPHSPARSQIEEVFPNLGSEAARAPSQAKR